MPCRRGTPAIYRGSRIKGLTTARQIHRSGAFTRSKTCSLLPSQSAGKKFAKSLSSARLTGALRAAFPSRAPISARSYVDIARWYRAAANCVSVNAPPLSLATSEWSASKLTLTAVRVCIRRRFKNVSERSFQWFLTISDDCWTPKLVSINY